MPNGQKHETYDYIIVDDNFHDRENNDYIPIASEPLYAEEVQQLIAGEVELVDFELTAEQFDSYSDKQWETAQKLEEDEWNLIAIE